MLGPAVRAAEQALTEQPYLNPAGRLMDEVDFGDSGRWPVAADGSGVSLARVRPGVPTALPESWASSGVVGGTPLRANFDGGKVKGAPESLVDWQGEWLYNESGADLGGGWAAQTYAAGAGGWLSGQGALGFENAPLATPIQTQLADPATSGVTTYYFQRAFAFAGDPSATELTLSMLVDDGAVFYLNGTEVARFNMPDGPVDAGTAALADVPNATVRAVALPGAALVAGTNTLSVSVHQAPQPPLPLLTPSGGGLALIAEGGTMSAGSNLALAANGGTAFAKDLIGNGSYAPTHTIPNLNNGTYGNSSSWIGNSPASFCGISLGAAPVALQAIAFGRANNDSHADRTLGIYTLQYTQVANPTEATPDGSWTTIGTLDYQAAGGANYAFPHRRHLFSFDEVSATGVRLLAPDGAAIDEIELYASVAPGAPDLGGGGLAYAGEGGAMNEFVNLALAANGGTAFAKDLIGDGIHAPTHTIANLNNGTYGNASSWIGNSPDSFCGVSLGSSPVPVQSIAFGRDNLAQFPDRNAGTYTLQFTQSPDPDESTAPGDWTTIGTITYPGATGFGFNSPALRHRYNFDPVSATGLRLLVPADAAVDEFEIYAEAGNAGDPLPPVALAPATGFQLGWDGNNGDHAGDPVPDNLALAANGAAAFGSGALVAPHTIAGANDGRYGNTYSWIGAGEPGQFIGVAFGFAAEFNAIAWGRSNVLTGDPCAGGVCTDRNLGTYTIQFTQVAAPDAATPATGDAATGWQDIGAVTYSGSVPTFTAHRRHQYSVALDGGGNITATAIRLLVSDPGIAIDEIEVYGPLLPDIAFAAELTAREILFDPAAPALVLSEVSAAGDAAFAIELFNPGASAVELSGFSVNGVPLPAQLLAPGGYATVTAAALGLAPASGDPLFLQSAGGPVVGAVRVGDAPRAYSASAGRYLTPSAPTPGAENAFALHDAVAINEIMYHFRDDPGADSTPAPNAEEWIELINKSGAPVDLSGWRIDGEVDFAFPDGTMIAAGDYLVVAEDAAALSSKYPGIASKIVGNFSGRLSNASGRIELEDAAGNPADLVTYAEGGRWPDLADGGGSSLELRDPRADNAGGGAWAASDESGKAAWQAVTYRMEAGQPHGLATWNEFRIGLLTAGEVLLDDLSVIEDPDGAAVEKIQNGAFNDAAAWRFLGNHRHSNIVPDPDGGGTVLRVVSDGPTDTKHNHLESTFAGNLPLTIGQTYEVSFRARWVRGSNQLYTGAFQAMLARTTLVERPDACGTPGAQNSAFTANAGPDLGALTHAPLVPAPGEPIRIAARAADPDGVAAVTLHYADAGGGFTSLPMADQGDGTYAADAPGIADGEVRRFYVSAEDTLGAVSEIPAAGAASHALITTAGGPATNLPVPEFRLIMTGADRDFLFESLNAMSNERIGATVVWNNEEVYYDVGVRLKGSAAARARDGDAYVGYNVDFNADQPFRGFHGGVSIDRSGRAPTARGQDEIYVKHAFNRAGIPFMYDDLIYLSAPRAVHDGTAILNMAKYDGSFVESQFGDPDGSVISLEITYDPSSTLDGDPESPKPPVPFIHIGTDFRDLGTDREAYRWAMEMRTGRGRDDYAGVIDFSQTIDLPTGELAAEIDRVMDVDGFMRCAALVNLFGIGDTWWHGGLQHNMRIYVPSGGGQVKALPWDLDFVFLSPDNAPLLRAAGNIRRVMDLPANTRLYYGHLLDLVNTVFDPTYMDPWLQHYGDLVGQNFIAQSGRIAGRRNFVLANLPAQVPFAITTNGGADFSVETASVVLQGGGWIDIREFRLAATGETLPARWIDGNTWEVEIPVLRGDNAIAIQAIGFQGDLLGEQSITVTSQPLGATPAEALRITELHFHPADPSAAEIDAGFSDDDEFEFVELRNISGDSLDISGAHFTDGIEFAFPSGTVLAAGERIVIASNAAAFTLRYGMAPAGEYSGQLNNGGETIELRDAPGNLIQRLTYRDDWFPAADGGGYSLAILDDSLGTEAWDDPASWGLSGAAGGNPGADNPFVSQQYGGWLYAHFTDAERADPQISGPEAINNPAGIPNLLAFAFATNPFDPDLSHFPQVSPTPDGAAVTFTTWRNLIGVAIAFEESGDLGGWGDATPAAESESPAGASVARTLEFAGEGEFFVRAKVTYAP
ncbi:MAG: lamin tail domain-containing protein [Verrucomicrobiales bacterium]